MKPITYLGAFMKGWAPATVIEDSPLVLNDGGRAYTLRNADGWYRGRVSVRQALGNSLNVPAVRAQQFVGLETGYAMSRQMGLSTLQDLSAYGPAFTLGGLDANLLDLTYVYAVLANGGEQSGTRNGTVGQGARHLDPVAVLRVENGHGRRLWEHRPQREVVVPAAPVYLVTNVLADNAARTQMFGVNNALTLPGRPAAVKTGLSDEALDAWAFGFTRQLVVGVWVGNVDNSPMRNATSGSTAAPIWQQLMSSAHQGQTVLDFPSPAGVQFVAVCASTGLPGGGCRDSVREVFVANTFPQAPSAQPVSGEAAPPPARGGKKKGKRD